MNKDASSGYSRRKCFFHTGQLGSHAHKTPCFWFCCSKSEIASISETYRNCVHIDSIRLSKAVHKNQQFPLYYHLLSRICTYTILYTQQWYRFLFDSGFAFLSVFRIKVSKHSYHIRIGYNDYFSYSINNSLMRHKKKRAMHFTKPASLFYIYFPIYIPLHTFLHIYIFTYIPFYHALFHCKFLHDILLYMCSYTLSMT